MIGRRSRTTVVAPSYRAMKIWIASELVCLGLHFLRHLPKVKLHNRALPVHDQIQLNLPTNFSPRDLIMQ